MLYQSSFITVIYMYPAAGFAIQNFRRGSLGWGETNNFYYLVKPSITLRDPRDALWQGGPPLCPKLPPTGPKMPFWTPS